MASSVGTHHPSSTAELSELALIARPGATPVVLSGVLVVQTTVLQSLLAGPADNAARYGGLYAMDGLLILGIAGGLYATSRRRRA